MAYTINKTDGTVLDTINDGVVSTVTDLALIGRNVPNYGELLNENLVKLLENFANTTPPTNPLVGELWFDTQTKSLKVFSNEWRPVSTTTVVADAANKPTVANKGDFWFNTTTQQLFAYDNEYKVVGPEAAAGFAVTRLVSDTVVDTNNSTHPIIKGFVDNEIVFVITKSSFVVDSLPGFSRLEKGVTLRPGMKVYGDVVGQVTGDLTGNAATATKLKTPRKINGIEFDGSRDITFAAAEIKTLSPGNYLSGDQYAGNIDTTWSVNATAENTGNTVVARDVQGNFSANEIKANLVGTASTANNIAGGSAGALAVQTSQSTTDFIAVGTANQLLVSNGNVPTWKTCIATASDVGMVKVGYGLTVTPEGTLSALPVTGIGGVSRQVSVLTKAAGQFVAGSQSIVLPVPVPAKSQIDLVYDGVYQHQSTYSVSQNGTTVTLSSGIPQSVQVIEAIVYEMSVSVSRRVMSLSKVASQFQAGATTITLPVPTSVVGQVDLIYDGIYQIHNTYKLSATGTTIELTSGIPSSVTFIDVITYQPADSVKNVSTFNTRAGDVVLTSNDIVSALGFTPIAGPLPTKTSQLTNDSGFITSGSIPSRTSQLTNDSGFLTSLPLHTHSFADIAAAFKAVNRLSDPGYQIFPGGLILQWGTVSSPTTSAAVQFPIQFPNTVFVVLTNVEANQTTAEGAAVRYLMSKTTSGATFRTWNSYPVHWLAIGM